MRRATRILQLLGWGIGFGGIIVGSLIGSKTVSLCCFSFGLGLSIAMVVLALGMKSDEHRG